MVGFGLLITFLFTFNINPSIGKTTHHSHSCPHAFVKLNGRCYHFGNSAANWFQALQQCALLGASLISLETHDEWKAINKHITKMFPATKPNLNADNKTLAITAAYWTSGTDLTGKKDWIWMGSGLPIFNTDWCPGQPDNLNGVEHCVKLLSSGDHHCWNDRNCFTRDTATYNKQTYYICELNHLHLSANLVKKDSKLC